MASRFFTIFFLIQAATAVISSESLNPAASPKAISDLRDAIVKGLGFQDMKVSGFDVRDALVGQSVAYEFDIEIDKKVVPVKLLEDVSRWEFVDLPIFRNEGKGLAKRETVRDPRVLPELPDFQLAGPMELWIQDGDDMRISLPHDVDAGTLKKVLLSDGAVVTVKGARSVSLRHPLELPLPFNRTHPKNAGRASIASGLLAIAESLRRASRSSTEHPLLSLRIVGPTSLSSAPSSSPNSNTNKLKLKLKRLAPGLVELSSRAITPSVSDSQPVPATPDDIETATFWPLTSINGLNANLRGFEELLASVLGKRASEEGSFKLLKAQVSAQNYVKMGFAVEKKLLEGDVDWSKFPDWKTRTDKVTAHYEVIARVEDGGKIVPERIAEVQPFQAVETVMESVQTGNVSMSQVETAYPLPNYFHL